ncbi:hypothetical protein BZL54_24420 [Burkholderia ubonensis subsp. mesacidophila]|uniref:Uncharacterized protein n=1 Tax=Burkholderia ubonensis subsp. mesacidophila TaxID=265293 RepID=A0A2A4F7D5_9BURK|nr:hypothetical protein BZL54_24420 [Burkholderia ubonensis subsp. mesacidophila]
MLLRVEQVVRVAACDGPPEQARSEEPRSVVTRIGVFCQNIEDYRGARGWLSAFVQEASLVRGAIGTSKRLFGAGKRPLNVEYVLWLKIGATAPDGFLLPWNLSPCHFHVLSERLYQQRQYRSDFLTKVVGCDDFLVKSLMCQAVAQFGDFLNGVSFELSHRVFVGIRS